MLLLAIAINIDKGTTVGEQWSFFIFTGKMCLEKYTYANKK